MEVASPGGFVGGITPGNIIHHEPKTRNRLPAETFQQLGLVNRQGWGVDRMYEVLLRYGKQPPRYVDSGDSVLVTITDPIDETFAAYIAQEVRRGKDFSLDEIIVLSHLRKVPEISIEAAAVACQRTPAEASEILTAMSRKYLLTPHGATRARSYSFSPTLYARFGKPSDYEREQGIDEFRFEALIMQYAEREGAVTSQECRSICGLNRNQTHYLLRKLVGKGILAKPNRGRSAMYRYIRKSNAENAE